MNAKALRVVADGVDIGSLSLGQYYTILTEVKRDWKLYVGQAMAYVSAACSILGRLAYTVPVVWFWLIAGAIYSMKSSPVTTFTGIGAEGAIAGLATSVTVACTVALIWAGIAVFIGVWPMNVVNVFDIAINRKICRTLGLDYTADLEVIPQDS